MIIGKCSAFCSKFAVVQKSWASGRTLGYNYYCYIVCRKLEKVTAREWQEHKTKRSNSANLP